MNPNPPKLEKSPKTTTTTTIETAKELKNFFYNFLSEV